MRDRLQNFRVLRGFRAGPTVSPGLSHLPMKAPRTLKRLEGLFVHDRPLHAQVLSM